MRILKTSLITALIAPVFAVSAFAMPYQDAGANREASKPNLSEVSVTKAMQERCAKAKDHKKCMWDAKGAHQPSAGNREASKPSISEVSVTKAMQDRCAKATDTKRCLANAKKNIKN
jgi:hypothetical protein